MAQITVESLSPDEESLLREVADCYGHVEFLDFQDISAVELMAKGLQRLLARLTAKPKADAPKKKVGIFQ